MPQGPLFKYRALIAVDELRDDAAQRLAIEKLQLLHRRLQGYNPAKPSRFGRGLFGWGREHIEEVDIQGLYLYGGVGRGKSMLMDLFFENAPVAKKRRVHFHAFMQEVHKGITLARQDYAKDPIEPVAARIAEGAALLCFDELQIGDITDAMIVGRLFDKLFARGVVIVATSNRHPDDLYKDGLNRQLFVPFIERIKERLEVFHLVSDTDYRQNKLAGGNVYFSPLNARARRGMDAAWEVFSVCKGKPLLLAVHGREVRLPLHCEGVARASFADLCEAPLGAADYLAIADEIAILLLDEVPLLSREQAGPAKRFVTLIDALYEAKTRLICSADAVPEQLFEAGDGAFEFARTASRLHEMASADWAARG
ncbi:MAG: cell division protein ZapE [Rhodobacteraceae bacterium]|nr:cell division protein ZapE [Paracoccaceae bacterium]